MQSPTLQPNQSVLFLDNFWVDKQACLWREIHPPQRLGIGPTLVADRPWEGHCVIARNAHYDKERNLYRLWYQTYNPAYGSPENTYLCYAESSDGVFWEKPELGLISYRGDTKNNIVLGNIGGLEPGSGGFDCPNVVYDESADNFKLTLYGWPQGRTGLIAATSPDGLQWTVREQPVLTEQQVWDTNTLLIDQSLEAPYVSFNRHKEMYERERRRCIYRSHSHDFENWTEPELILAPDLAEEPNTEFYAMSVQKVADIYVGFLQVLHRSPVHPSEDWQSVRLATSRDSFNWEVVEPRRDFFAPGPPGSFDSKWVYLPQPILPSPKGQLLFFYDGRPVSHGAAYPTGAVGAASIDHETFCSLSANVGGTLQTKPFLLPEGELRINARLDHGGKIHTELLPCEGQKTERLLIGQPVVLRITIERAHLFSFRFSA